MSTSPIVRLATASLIGTTLEYYDFAVYSTLAALVFNRLFFPSFDPLSGTILALSTFAVGYRRPADRWRDFWESGRTFWSPLRARDDIGRDGHNDGDDRSVADIRISGNSRSDSAGSASVCAGRCPRRRVGRRVLLCVEHGSDTQRGRNGAWTQVGPSLGTLIATGLLAWIAAVFIACRVPGMGLAIAVPGECFPRYLRTLDQARRRRDAGL